MGRIHAKLSSIPRLILSQCRPQITVGGFRQSLAVEVGFVRPTISCGMELDDQHHFDEAEGWLELGNFPEAEAALNRISPGTREQPAVLEMRFHICAQTDRWDEAHELGKDFLVIEPESLNAPALVARALHRLGRSKEAYELLKPVCDAFPGE
jgi:predicted Zn-dependent protease